MTPRRMVFAALLLVSAAQAQTLQQARDSVDARQFGQAIPVYEDLLRVQPSNTDLLIETARVYGYADRHKEAISKYRRVIEVDPERLKDVAAALAWQTLWSGNAAAALTLFEQARGFALDPKAQTDLWRGAGEACVTTGDNACALNAYRKALALTPGNKDLQRRIALVLLWLDEYAQAEVAWRALLVQDPKDRRAQAGLARTINAAGRHNEAVRLYEEIDDGSEADLRLDHARALRWAGFDAAALPLLNARTDDAAVFLRDWRIDREQKKFVWSSIDYSVDSDKFDTRAVAAGGGAWLKPGLLLESTYRFARLDSPGRTVNANRLQATLRGLNGTPGVTPPGLLIPTLTLALNDYDGWTPLTGSASVRWMPQDLWRFTAELGREVVETPQAIGNRITAYAAALGTEYRLPPRWTIGGTLSGLRFSNGNNRVRVYGHVDYATRFNPKVVIGIEGTAFNDSKPASFAAGPSAGRLPAAGYWSPKDYADVRLFAGVYHDRGDWQAYARVALGVSRETDGDGLSSSGHPNLLEAGIEHDVGPGLRWRLYAGGSGSGFAVGSGGTGYWRRYVGLTLTGWF
ncbi:MAG: tetratricopeptide repeat protein [Burkholderiales bacterium]